MHDYAIPLGGVLAGSGIICLIYGFQANTGKDMALSQAELGYRALDQLQVLPAGFIGFALIATAVVLLVASNATAWRRTGGY